MAWYVTYDYRYNYAQNILGGGSDENWSISRGTVTRTSSVVKDHPIDWYLYSRSKSEERLRQAHNGEGTPGPAHGWYEPTHLAWFTEVPDIYLDKW